MKNVICDIDGVLADASHRVHLIADGDAGKSLGKDADWDAYYAYDNVIKDKLIESMADILFALYYRPNKARKITLLTGRSQRSRIATEDWLLLHKVKHDQLIMRPQGNREDDSTLKLKQLAEAGITVDNTLCIFEDRQRIVDAYRAAGFRVYQPQPGDF